MSRFICCDVKLNKLWQVKDVVQPGRRSKKCISVSFYIINCRVASASDVANCM